MPTYLRLVPGMCVDHSMQEELNVVQKWVVWGGGRKQKGFVSWTVVREMRVGRGNKIKTREQSWNDSTVGSAVGLIPSISYGFLSPAGNDPTAQCRSKS